MPAPARSILLGAMLAVMPLTGCQAVDAASSSFAITAPVTATVVAVPGATPALSTDVRSAGPKWAGGSDGTGVFSVGDHARDGNAAVIPPGRYEVRLAAGASEGGWMLCSNAPCGPAFQENATVVGHAFAPYAAGLDIRPNTRSVWLDNVVLSPAAD